MKTVSIIFLVLCLFQAFAGFNPSCASCMGIQGSVDTSGDSGTVPLHQDADSIDCSDSHDDNSYLKPEIAVISVQLVAVAFLPEPDTKLLKVVMPIFVPPQNLA